MGGDSLLSIIRKVGVGKVGDFLAVVWKMFLGYDDAVSNQVVEIGCSGSSRIPQVVDLYRCHAMCKDSRVSSKCETIEIDGYVQIEAACLCEHYIPIDMADPLGSVERFMDSRSRWAEIAHGGREWALEHYSPVSCACRLLGMLK